MRFYMCIIWNWIQVDTTPRDNLKSRTNLSTATYCKTDAGDMVERGCCRCDEAAGTEHSVVFADESYTILQGNKQEQAMLAAKDLSLRPLLTGYSLHSVVA